MLSVNSACKEYKISVIISLSVQFLDRLSEYFIVLSVCVVSSQRRSEEPGLITVKWLVV